MPGLVSQGNRSWKNAHLFVEVGRPRKVRDGGIYAPSEVLKNHGGDCVLWMVGVVVRGHCNDEVG